MNERAEYIQRLEVQINEAQRTLDHLKASRDQALQAAQHEEVERLEEHLEQAQVRFVDIREAAGEAWRDLIAGMDETMHVISEMIKKLVNR